MISFEEHIQSNLNSFGGFPDKVKKEINKSLRLRKSSIAGVVNRCESPIEQLLAVQMVNVEDHLYRELPVLRKFKSIHIAPQKEVLSNGRKYRLDFLIECNMSDKKYNFAIECDGHDFHEKTKEQAARDKARERNLMSEGYIFIRFTGSEIWNDPSKCASDIVNIISKTVGLNDYYEKLFEAEYN